mgnify:CR=1 FL=1
MGHGGGYAHEMKSCKGLQKADGQGRLQTGNDAVWPAIEHAQSLKH